MRTRGKQATSSKRGELKRTDRNKETTVQPPGAKAMGRRAVFLDRDGVINALVYHEDAGVIDAPFTRSQFRLLPRVPEAIRLLNDLGLRRCHRLQPARNCERALEARNAEVVRPHHALANSVCGRRISTGSSTVCIILRRRCLPCAAVAVAASPRPACSNKPRRSFESRSQNATWWGMAFRIYWRAGGPAAARFSSASGNVRSASSAKPLIFARLLWRKTFGTQLN